MSELGTSPQTPTNESRGSVALGSSEGVGPQLAAKKIRIKKRRVGRLDTFDPTLGPEKLNLWYFYRSSRKKAPAKRGAFFTAFPGIYFGPKARRKSVRIPKTSKTVAMTG